jgi:hypothetical protein
MCTVTVLRAGDTVRVACNRDERRVRSQAHPPFITRIGTVHVLTPQDPQGGGTWIAANSYGLVFALLNRHVSVAIGSEAVRSRGLVIPALADSATLDEAAYRINDLQPREFAPFKLLVADLLDVSEFFAQDGEWRAHMHRLSQPLLFTSSSLGDELVDGPRRLLFEQMLGTPCASTSLRAGPSTSLRAGDVKAQQDAFHAHRWRDRPAISVHMSRPDACTVSTTTVEVTARHVRMLYQPAHCDAGTPVGLVIDRQDVSDAAAPRARGQYAAV